VLDVNRNAAFGVGALLGAAAALVWDRRTRMRPESAPDTRQRLRQKLAEAHQVPPAEEAVSPEPSESPKPPPSSPPPSPPPPSPPPPTPEARPSPPAPPPGPPPTDEFEAMRRRIHEEGKAAAEEMRQAPDEPT